MEDIAQIIRDCANRIIRPRFRNLQDDEIKSKTGPMDLVTIADIEAEYYLQEQIGKLDNSALIVGEESISRKEYSLDQVKSYNEGAIYIVDPVDGTNNFARGVTTFAVMVACVEDGICRKGWIYDVMADEMTMAEKGGGAFCEGEALHVNNEDSGENLRGFASKRFLGEEMTEHFVSCQDRLKMTPSLSCAGHEYLQISKGLQDFSIYTRTMPWDHLAGTLICQEAGGVTTKWGGDSYEAYDMWDGLITCNNKSSWNYIHNMLISPFI